MSSRRRFIASGIAILLAAGAAYPIWLLAALLACEIDGAVPSPPVFVLDEAFRVERRTPEGIEYSVNNSTASFDLDVETADEHCRRIFRSYAEVVEHCRSRGLRLLPSVGLVQAKFKQLDDSLCAAFETAVQRGIEPGRFPGKRETLRRLLGKLRELRSAREMTPEAAPAYDAAIVHVAAALDFGGSPADLDPSLLARVERDKAEFLESPLRSRPIGFWTGSEELEGLFRQDRFLMQGLSLEEDLTEAVAIASALRADPGLLGEIERLQDIDGKLTNPVRYLKAGAALASEGRLVPWRDLATRIAPPAAEAAGVFAEFNPDSVRKLREDLAREHGSGAGFALIAYSTSKECTLLRSLSVDGELSGARAAMDLLIDAVKEGRLSLEPGPDSGWYDRQLHALETLLLPERGRESAKLTLSDAYRERLRTAFASMITRQRETHIKHLPVLTLCNVVESLPPPRVEIVPELSVEPAATVYLRLARGYRFIRDALRAILGEGALRSLRRGGPGRAAGDKSIEDDLEEAAALLYGLYETVCFEIGQHAEYLEGEMDADRVGKARQEASAWLSSLHADPELSADARVAVPIFADDAGNLTHWATCGVRLDRVVVRYDRKPQIEGEIEPVLVPAHWYAPADIFVEFSRRGPSPLTRDEFRAICDAAGDEASLCRVLGGPQRPSRPQPLWPWAAAGIVAAAAAIRYGRRQITWRRSLAAAGILCAAALLWILALVLFPVYRIRFLVRQVATRSENLALDLEFRWTFDIDPRQLVPALAGILDDEDPQVRYLAARFLCTAAPWKSRKPEGYIPDPALLDAFQRASRDPVPEVAVAATYLLGEFRAPGNVDFLLARLDESRKMDTICASALGALGTIGDPGSVEAALAFTRDSREPVRLFAIRWLHGYDDPRVVERLRELVLTSDPEAAAAATLAIQWWSDGHANRVEPRLDEALLVRASKDELPAWRRFDMVEAIGAPANRARAYLEIIRSPTADEEGSAGDCRDRAGEELKALDAKAEVAPVLEEAARDPDDAVRAAAREALEVSGS